MLQSIFYVVLACQRVVEQPRRRLKGESPNEARNLPRSLTRSILPLTPYSRL